jgi:acetyl-CoA carboxylase biotin carboxylase subunit
MRRALAEYIVEGVRTSIPFHQRAMENSLFVDGNYDTTFVQKMRDGVQ